MSDEDRVAAVFVEWWKDLHADNGRSRAAAARLRRCPSVFDALLERETHMLLRQILDLGRRNFPADIDRRVAVIAMTLAHARYDGALPFATQLGRTPDGKLPDTDDKARFSILRFGALMRAAEARDWDRLSQSLRRAVAMLRDVPFDIGGFARDLIWLGDRSLQRWTYHYWQNKPPGDSSASSPLSQNETESVP